MADPSRLRLALDHNFPTPILALLERYLPDLDLVPVKTIDHRMPDLGDRELILALHQAGWPVLVTSNYKMLRNPKELAAILRTKLTVVAIEGVGDDMLRATGALLLDLPGIVNGSIPTQRRSSTCVRAIRGPTMRGTTSRAPRPTPAVTRPTSTTR